jgi:hypothetical protein
LSTEQDGKLHGETKGEMKKLKDSVDLVKNSVDSLARARPVDRWILFVGAIAAAAALIAVALSIFLKH